MRARATAFSFVALALVAACAGTPIQREMKAAALLTTSAKSIENSAQFGIADKADNQRALEIVKGLRDVLKQAIANRRADRPGAADALLDSIFAGVLKVAAILEGKG